MVATEISPYVIREEFQLWTFHLDAAGRFPLNKLVSRLIHTAGLHADHYGFGVMKLQERGYTWALHRLAIRFEKPIRNDAPFSITTFVTDVGAVKTTRNFLVHQGDTLVCTATSYWVAMDMHTRRAVPLAHVLSKEVEVPAPKGIELPCPVRTVWGKEEEANKIYGIEHKVKYSDLDINNHVNSAIWVALAMDTLPIEEVLSREVEQVDIHFIAEAACGADLRTCYAPYESGYAVMVSSFDEQTPHFCIKLKFRQSYE
ncbi:MAG: thioesterase [Porphyromonas sp.]|nr:thioesterase [Porphyromonas sp.]